MVKKTAKTQYKCKYFLKDLSHNSALLNYEKSHINNILSQRHQLIKDGEYIC
jgi:hypothetical protein